MELGVVTTCLQREQVTGMSTASFGMNGHGEIFPQPVDNTALGPYTDRSCEGS